MDPCHVTHSSLLQAVHEDIQAGGALTASRRIDPAGRASMGSVRLSLISMCRSRCARHARQLCTSVSSQAAFARSCSYPWEQNLKPQACSAAQLPYLPGLQAVRSIRVSLRSLRAILSSPLFLMPNLSRFHTSIFEDWRYLRELQDLVVTNAARTTADAADAPCEHDVGRPHSSSTASQLPGPLRLRHLELGLPFLHRHAPDDSARIPSPGQFCSSASTA